MKRGNKGGVRNIPELLAPAGTVEAFHAALEAGADAIYISPQILNARAYGKNFSIKQIASLTETARGKGVKTFIALNSVMKEREIADCVRLLAQLEEIGVDALIVQDLGIARIARLYFPSLRLHASTLMTIHNSLGVKTCESLGFSRVVLARELTLQEIGQIVRKSNLEIEIFVHGAMCFSVSGLCRFSSFYGCKSSTRGRCVQPCRRQYRWDNKYGTFFSMDDLCAIDLLKDIARIGVTSLKIEGRLKPANYIYHVVKAYRMALDHLKDEDAAKYESALDELKKAMGRPTTKGFFLGTNRKDLVSPTRTANTGIFLSKIDSYRNGILNLSSECDIDPGDRIRIVIKKLDKQIATRVKSVQGPGQITIPPNSVARELESRLKGALLFKTDSGQSGKDLEFQSKAPGIKTDSFEKIMEQAEIKAKNVLLKLQPKKGKTSQVSKKDQEFEIAIFLSEPWALKDFLKSRLASCFILPLTRKNLSGISRLKGKELRKKRIIWHLPPLSFGRQEENLLELYQRAKAMGFREFQASNLGHLSLNQHRVKMTSSFELNLLNSQALRAIRELGVVMPQFSIETDMENLESALAHVPFKVSLTAYGFIPLFTTRVKHSSYNPKKMVESLKGERFHWKHDGQIGYLYPSAPVSFLEMGQHLAQLGVSRFIIDLRFLPSKNKRLPRLPSSQKTLKNRFRGRNFNLKGKLH